MLVRAARPVEGEPERHFMAPAVTLPCHSRRHNLALTLLSKGHVPSATSTALDRSKRGWLICKGPALLVPCLPFPFPDTRAPVAHGEPCATCRRRTKAQAAAATALTKTTQPMTMPAMAPPDRRLDLILAEFDSPMVDAAVVESKVAFTPVTLFAFRSVCAKSHLTSFMRRLSCIGCQ